MNTDSKLLAEKAIKWGQTKGPLQALSIAGEAIQATVNPGITSACWRFNYAVGAKGTHFVEVGDLLPIVDAARFPASMGTGTRSNNPLLKALAGFARKVVVHESGHAEHTSRDLPLVAAEAGKAKVPFRNWNLGEDIRIECKSRAKHGNFLWQKWQAIPTVSANAWEWLWAVKSRDGNRKKVRWSGKFHTAKNAPALGLLWKAYRNLEAARDSFTVLPILADLARHFPDPMPETIPVGATIGGLAEPAGNQPDAGKALPDMPCAGKWMSNEMAAPDGARVRRLALRLREITRRAGEIADDIGGSGQKLMAATAAAGSADCWRRSTAAGGKPLLCLVLDCSGSMADTWCARGGRELALAWGELMKRREIDVTIAVSFDGGHLVLDGKTKEEVWHAICPVSGSDGFRATLNALAPVLRRSKLVVCYSDGQLSAPVDAGEWRLRGVDLLGTAIVPAGDPTAGAVRDALVKHFGAALVGESAEDLASQIGRRLGARRW
jgi:hypothetical protein